MYTLTYPNEEVRQSLNSSLLCSILNIKDAEAQTEAHAIRKALNTEDITSFT